MLYNSGARVSEIIGVRVADVVLDGAACVHLRGKGGKQRSVPLWRSTVKEIRAWLKINPQLSPTSALLPNRDGEIMTRDNVTKRLMLAVTAAAKLNASLENRRITPHTVRHTTAMNLLQSGVDISLIALWLGHENPATTHHYVEADLAMKESARPIAGARRDVATLSGIGLFRFIGVLEEAALCRALKHARYHSENGRDANWKMAIHNRVVFITLDCCHPKPNHIYVG